MSERLTDEELREMGHTDDGETYRLVTEHLALRAYELNRDKEVAALRARVGQLEAALISMTKGANWKSADKDNMEFEGQAMTDAEFYNELDNLASVAMADGLSRELVIEALRLLANTLDNEHEER